MRQKNYLLLFFFTLFLTSVYAQTNQVQFGKNRIQYHDDFDEWLMYESYNFITYWYGKGRNIGQSVVLMAEQDYDAIQNILEHRMNDKIEIIVYTDLTDLKQSNIGSEEAFMNTGGQTKIVGNKIFVYFNGNHNDLRRQVREGIASVYLNAMLFGANLQEIVQNAVMMNLPDWFKDGLIAYVGNEWSTEMDDRLRDVIMNEDFEDFEDIANKYPKLAGHALWYYIGQNYGKSTVSNLLYLTRINRSVESGFLYVLGSSYNRTLESWMVYFEQRYNLEAKGLAEIEGEHLKIKNKRRLPITQVKISPDGKNIAYVQNEIGKYKVFIQDVKTGKRKMIQKGGFRNAFQATDYNYPLLSWNPNNQELGMIIERRDVIKTVLYDVNTKKKAVDFLDPQYDRIYSMDYINPSKLVLTGQVNGHSDVFIYIIPTRQTQRITNDFWDDLGATYVNVHGQKGILFSSNRQGVTLERAKLDSILPINTFDLFFYSLERGKNSKELVRVTNTPLANEWHPIAVDTTWFSYLSDQNGIYNRQSGYLEDYIAYYEKWYFLNDGSKIILHQDSTLDNLDTTMIDSTQLHPIIKTRALTRNNTNYNRNIGEQDSAPRVGKLVESIFVDDTYKIFVREMNPKEVVEPRTTRFHRQKVKRYESTMEETEDKTESENTSGIQILEEVNETPINVADVPEEKKDTTKIDIDNYMFQSEFDDEEIPSEVIVVEEDKGDIKLQRPAASEITVPVVKEDKSSNVVKFRPARIIPYRLKFRTDYITTTLDNSLLFGGLDTYAGNRQEFAFPPPGILLKANFKDLFEDYIVEGGVRLPTTFNGTEFFLLFDNKKGRFDKRFAAYRRSSRFSQETLSFLPNRKLRETTFIGYYEMRYPLDIFRSLRASATLRLDNSIQLSTDAQTLSTPVDPEQRFGIRLEYVFDNTLDVGINLKNGTRYKVFAEVLKRFDVELIDDFKVDFAEGFMTVLGVDARHYQRLDKKSILALRFAASTSFGSENILYTMGGVDGWLFPSFNDEIPYPQSDNFAYQTLATNIRGFRNNIRNGASYALFNAELRIPLIRYLAKNIRSSFFRNFQATGFFDVGTAWQGLTPFAEENPLNTTTISSQNAPVSIRVNYFRDPIVAGYGFGVRSMLFGYFIRLDYGWGIETRVVQEPRWHFALGLDF
ncbi:MAG: hypothetical protein AAF573_10705 [Bacteroidota bacterium]